MDWCSVFARRCVRSKSLTSVWSGLFNGILFVWIAQCDSFSFSVVLSICLQSQHRSVNKGPSSPSLSARDETHYESVTSWKWQFLHQSITSTDLWDPVGSEAVVALSTWTWCVVCVFVSSAHHPSPFVRVNSVTRWHGGELNSLNLTERNHFKVTQCYWIKTNLWRISAGFQEMFFVVLVY